MPVDKTIVGKSVPSPTQTGTGNAGAFRKRLTKVPSKLVSPFKPYIRLSKVPVATAMEVRELICNDESLKR